MTKMVGQGYDSAAAMSGRDKGVQQYLHLQRVSNSIVLALHVTSPQPVPRKDDRREGATSIGGLYVGDDKLLQRLKQEAPQAAQQHH